MKDNQYELNKGLAQILKGGVIMDVSTPEQAKIAPHKIYGGIRIIYYYKNCFLKLGG